MNQKITGCVAPTTRCAPLLHSTRHGLLTALVALGGMMVLGQAHSQEHHQSSHGSHDAPTGTSALSTSTSSTQDNQELSEGEVKRWDASSQKVTLRHGELKNLNMPPMTMVFKLQDASQASQLKVGDKVRFRAEQVNGGFVVTHLEPVN